MFTRIVTAALLAGAGGGLVAALLQIAFVQPVLLVAELYEAGRLAHAPDPAAPASDPATSALGWSGVDPVRDGLSVVFTMLVYTGYALVLVPLMMLAERRGSLVNARTGLVWGVAAFVAVHAAPAFSLAPELPGSAAGDLGARQIWWYATLAATGLAAWLVAFGRSWTAWGAAVLLALAPHVVGAPMPAVLEGPAPPEIASLFAARSLGVGLAAWLAVGALAGHFWRTAAVPRAATA